MQDRYVCVLRFDHHLDFGTLCFVPNNCLLDNTFVRIYPVVYARLCIITVLVYTAVYSVYILMYSIVTIVYLCMKVAGRLNGT